MQIQPFFHKPTNTMTYVVWDEDSRDAVVIDPVLDFDDKRISVSDAAAREVVGFCREHGLKVGLAIDTHVHADHLSGQQVIAEALGAKTAISARIAGVQATFAEIFGLDGFRADGSQWDVLLSDGVPVRSGSIEVLPMATPGHTPACTTLRIGDALFTGDTMFMPDFGTGRCDFPGGSAEQLYDSIQRLYALPDATRVFVGHDYGTGGREIRWETTIGASKAQNVQLRADTSKEQFVAWRSARDATLDPPRLIFQSLRVNMGAGRLPEPAANGRRYLPLPMGLFG